MGSFIGGKVAGQTNNTSSSAEVKNVWFNTSAPLIGLYGVYRDKINNLLSIMK
jgi:hypothetical protein